MGCATSRQKKSGLSDSKAITRSIISLKIRKNIPHRRSAARKENNFKEFYLESPLKSLQENPELNEGLRVVREKTALEKTELTKVLMEHFLFNSLPLKSITSLLKDFILYNFFEDSTIFTQNSVGQYFYIVLSGSVEVIINQVSKSIIKKAGSFGDLALLHDTLRTATLKTLEPTSLWVLSRSSFKAAVKQVSKSKHTDNKHFIDSISILNPLTSSQKSLMLNLLVSQEFKAGERIILEGDPGDIFYIIKKGIVSCSIKGMEIRRLSVGEFFGEQALIYSTQRTATVTALTKLSVLSLGAEDLIEVFGSKLQDIIYKNSLRISFERSTVLKYLKSSQVDACIEKMTINNYLENSVVFNKGDLRGASIAVVVKGALLGGQTEIKTFDCVGDMELKTNPGIFTENFIASVDTDIAVISRNDFEDCIGGGIESVTSYNELISVLRNVHILRMLPAEKLDALVSLLSLCEFPKGSVIFNQGDAGDCFYIVKSGQVDVVKDGVCLRTVSTDDFFGERAIIFNEVRTATTITKADCKLWMLKKADFLSLIGEPLKNQLMHRISLQNDTITLEDLKLVRVIGEGMFGKVHLVQNTHTKVKYALKMVERWKISEYSLYENLKLERKILLQLDHPMMMKLVKTFKDEERIYFLCELVQGIDLFDAVREIDKMDESISVFYISCLLLILKYLHERSIIYRDLKPENVMIDQDGYPKLVDFGTAKIIKTRTFTVMGTPHYMAPEIIRGAGYGVEVDYWSLGVILYEFLFYNLPFANDEEDAYKIYKCILEEPLTFPDFANAYGCIPLLQKLLNRNQTLRGPCENIMKNPWFDGVRWSNLLSKGISAPFIPVFNKTLFEINSAEDYKNILESAEELRSSKQPQKKYEPTKDWDQEF